MSQAGPAAVTLADELGETVVLGASLASYCTYKVGGRAAAMVNVESLAQLETVKDVVSKDRVPTLMVGRGSNLLVSDAGFDGIAIRLGDSFAEVAVDNNKAEVIAGGAALMPVVARQSAAAGLTGFEWAVGVPGSIGGGVRMNAGGHGSDIAASLLEVSVFDLYQGGPVSVERSGLDLSYRRSNLTASSLVLFARFGLAQGNAEASNTEISEIVRWRRANQPGGQNAGSVFTNPAEDSAGRLIDESGLKGFRVGTAEVSTKHANFIQADPGGSADDVWALIQHIQSVVLDASGVFLVPENRMIGFNQ
jgi:UDP-N-acetylmuramate dehydrogenase